MSGKNWLMLMLTAAAVAGCHHNSPPPPNRGDAFASDPSDPPARQFVTAQAASGAREDATLRPMHFDGGRLNSLGRQKLDLMARGEDASQALVVYLDLPETAPVKDARGAVADFLKSLGVSEQQIRIEDGPNPTASGPAAKAIADLKHMSEEKQNSKENDTAYQPSSAPPAANGLNMTNH